MIKSMDIADYFVQSSINQGIEINNLKLQKLLYYFYAKNLVENKGNIFDEKFEKWQYGPVLPTVYHAYKQFEGADIKEVPNRYVFNDLTGEFEKSSFDESKLHEDLRKCIDSFVSRLKNYDAFDLVERTHKHDEWKKDELRIQMGIKNIKYDDELTKKYFINHSEECLW